MPKKTQRALQRDLEIVFNAIKKYPMATANEIADITGFCYLYTRRMLQMMVRKGTVHVNTKYKRFKRYIIS